MQHEIKEYLRHMIGDEWVLQTDLVDCLAYKYDIRRDNAGAYRRLNSLVTTQLVALKREKVIDGEVDYVFRRRAA